MQLISNKNQCCGCTACYSVCPKNAITMEYDEEGFLYPLINNELCVDCGMCKSVCAFQNGYEKHPVIKGYALKHKNLDTRMTSRSGGAFAGISHHILSLGGIVYGAVYNDDFSVSHFRCDNGNDLKKIQGVKYIQSEMNDIFSQVKADLKADKYVLFSGTACQVAGLLAYLRTTDTSKLFTADLICHGVPNNMIWQEFLRWNERKYKGTLQEAKFRDKCYGWKPHFESVTINNKKHKTKKFALMFYENDILRPSCYECKYASLDRVADFTLGDFWGLKKQHKEMFDQTGTSLFLINTQKGQELFSKIENNFILKDTNFVKASFPNPNLRFPTPKPAKREYFWELYRKYDFDTVMKIYDRKILVTRIKKNINKIKRLIKH